MRALLQGKVILAPLTRGGNLPFRRLCKDFGADITISEMAYAREVIKGRMRERALLRKHPLEEVFGAQIAACDPQNAVEAGLVAVECGASFVDLNAGCPIHEAVRRGMGARLLKNTEGLRRILEAMVSRLPVPVTVKLRTGWQENRTNLPELGAIAREAGVAAIAVHGRSREQRYTRAADWEAIARLVEQIDTPVIGNGDILTYYEARHRWLHSGVTALMVGRGALIKPWIFQEIREARELQPTAAERISIYHRLAGYFKEHFGADEMGRRLSMSFLPWHFSFFRRYRPLPEQPWEARSRVHPLLQTRFEEVEEVHPLEGLLRSPDPQAHERIAETLWECAESGEAVERLQGLADDPTLAAPARTKAGK
ncbi:MAG: tRNA-dihydrouridine synthase family protein [Armatimonadetes bacterium]|nr:tRNA-dihydrouridine synthase family protein [Armatimonadota bacterium]